MQNRGNRKQPKQRSTHSQNKARTRIQQEEERLNFLRNLIHVPDHQIPGEPDPRLVVLLHEVVNAINNDQPMIMIIGNKLVETRMDLDRLREDWHRVGMCIDFDCRTEDGRKNFDLWQVVGKMLCKEDEFQQAMKEMDEKNSTVVMTTNKGWKCAENDDLKTDGYTIEFMKVEQ